MYQVMVKLDNEFVAPNKFHDSLTDESMNTTISRPQARHFKNEIKKKMKAGDIPTSPVAIMMDKVELMKKKMTKKKTTAEAPTKKQEMVPVVEGEDPLAV